MNVNSLHPSCELQIAKLVMEYKVDGLVISNTTVTRADSLQSEYKKEKGGLSGKPLREVSTDCIREMYAIRMMNNQVGIN